MTDLPIDYRPARAVFDAFQAAGQTSLPFDSLLEADRLFWVRVASNLNAGRARGAFTVISETLTQTPAGKVSRSVHLVAAADPPPLPLGCTRLLPPFAGAVLELNTDGMADVITARGSDVWLDLSLLVR